MIFLCKIMCGRDVSVKFGGNAVKFGGNAVKFGGNAVKFGGNADQIAMIVRFTLVDCKF